MRPGTKSVLDRLISTLLHVPYVWGGCNSSDGLDCSGLIVELLQSVGAIPSGFDSTAQGLFNKFGAFEPGQVEFGDLVFFGGSDKTITHVGFCLGDGFMLEAGGGGRKCVSRQDGINANARVRIRPISIRKDLIGYRRPSY